MLTAMSGTGLNMETELTLRIVLQEPPAGVDFAVQKGHGSAYEPVQKQRSKGKDLTFEFTVGVKRGRDATMPEFTGNVGPAIPQAALKSTLA